MASISPHLWFDNNASEAVDFYLSVFADSEIVSGASVEGPSGGAIARPDDVQVIDFRIGDLRLSAFNGGPHHEFNDAISLAVTCGSDAEVDDVWDGLSVGGYALQCGWVRDKYGVAWQIVPDGLIDLLGHPDPAKANRAVAAMLNMSKIVLADIEAAMHGDDQQREGDI